MRKESFTSKIVRWRRGNSSVLYQIDVLLVIHFPTYLLSMPNLTGFYLHTIRKLKELNYVNWKSKMQTLIEGYNI